MRSNRLVVLLVVTALLALARFAYPPAAREYAIAAPVVRTQVLAAVRPGTMRPPDSGVPVTAPTREIDVPGNAFPVRVLPPPAPVPTAPAPATPVVAPTAPLQAIEPPVQPPPPPPLQVIGTYDDGGAPAVFVATPIGTVVARPGTMLMSDYRVTAITAQAVALTQESTQRTLQIAVPGRTQ